MFFSQTVFLSKGDRFSQRIRRAKCQYSPTADFSNVCHMTKLFGHVTLRDGHMTHNDGSV